MEWRTNALFTDRSWPYGLELRDDHDNVLGVAIYERRNRTTIWYKFGDKLFTLKHSIDPKIASETDKLGY